MSESDVAALRVEMRQIKEDLAETQKTVREMRDLMMQARGGMGLLRWVFGGTLVTALGVAAMVYGWIRSH